MAFEVRQMPDREYFADPGVDQSALKRFMVSPKAYVSYLDYGPDVSADVLDFGKAAHSLVLDTYERIEDMPNLNTKAGRERLKQLRADDVAVVSAEDRERLHGMYGIANPYFSSLSGRPEVAVFADDPKSGLRLKGKYDFLPDGPDEDGVLRIRDYKTTGSDPRDFPREAYRLGYHIQAAYYMMLYRLTGYKDQLGFEFVVQEKKRPYDYMLWRMDEDSQETIIACRRIGSALHRMADMKRGRPDEWRHPDSWQRLMLEHGLDKTPRQVHFTRWQIDHEYGEMNA